MKKRYLKYGQLLAPAAFILSLAACKKDDFLTVAPKGSLTNTATFSTAANADLFINDIYEQLPDINNEDQILDQYTDNNDVGATWMTGQAVVRSNSINPANVPPGPANEFLWSATTPGTAPLGNYDKIRKCNVFFQQAALNIANFDPGWYKQRVGEIHFLRAFFYTLLYTNYGGVPLISVPLNNEGADTVSLFAPRSTADQTLAYIEADCDTAAMDLPLAATQSGRATQGAALALKGWVQLFAASPLSNPANDVSKWATAAATNLQVMNLGVYSLFIGPDSTGYQEQFLAANNWNPETIFARGYATPSNGHRREGLVGPVIVHGTEQAWGNLAPTQNLVDDYEMDNGRPITDPLSGYDPQHPYVGRELRFYESIVYDSSEWQGDIWESRIGGNNQIDLGSRSDISNTGYNAKKTLDESINGQASLNISPGTSNYIYYRYAEVLLSYAEAQNEAVGPDASVYNAVNLVRARSHLAALPAGLSPSDMRTAIRRERRVELAFEDKRWFDIRRWDITAGATGVLNTPEYGMQISPQTSGAMLYQKVQVFSNTFSEHMNWLPIPQAAMNQNKNLTQNPGY